MLCCILLTETTPRCVAVAMMGVVFGVQVLVIVHVCV